MAQLLGVQVARYARDAGLTGEPLVIAVAIAKGESNWRTDARLHTSREDSRGLWQINTFAHPWAVPNQLYDPAYAAAAMMRVSNGGTNWRPWSVYTQTDSPRYYLQYMAEARAAVAALGGTGVLQPAGELSAEQVAALTSGVQPPQPAVTPPPTVSLIPGLTPIGPKSLRLEGQELSGLCEVLTASLDRRIDDVARVEARVNDPHNRLLESGLLSIRARTTIDRVIFELLGSRRIRRDITLTLVDAAAAEYINDIPDEPISQAPGTGSRGDFLRRLASRHEWVPVDIETGAVPLVELASRPGESVWQTMNRTAADVGWRCFATANRLIIGSDKWLASRTAPLELVEGQGGVDRIDFEFLAGERSSRATVYATAVLWQAPPSQAVRLSGVGPADGDWLVESVAKQSIASTQVTVKLTRAQPVLDEPVPSVPADYKQPEQDEGGKQVQAGQSSKDGWQWPMAGRISSGFGPRPSPGGIGSTNHKGLDIAAPAGTPIYAARSGTVAHAGTAGGYGFAVYLDHGGGLISRYGHMRKQPPVTRGQQVAQGQKIGECGQTGAATGNHLHFEIRPGNSPVDPLPLLPAR